MRMRKILALSLLGLAVMALFLHLRWDAKKLAKMDDIGTAIFIQKGDACYIIIKPEAMRNIYGDLWRNSRRFASYNGFSAGGDQVSFVEGVFQPIGDHWVIRLDQKDVDYRKKGETAKLLFFSPESGDMTPVLVGVCNEKLTILSKRKVSRPPSVLPNGCLIWK